MSEIMRELRAIRELMEGHTDRLAKIDAKQDEEGKLIAERAVAHDKATKALTEMIGRVAEALEEALEGGDAECDRATSLPSR